MRKLIKKAHEHFDIWDLLEIVFTSVMSSLVANIIFFKIFSK